MICVNRFSLLSLSISGHTLSLYHVSMCQILSSCVSESCRHPLPSCSVTRKADPQWLHRRSMRPLPSVWVWPMEAWCRSLEAERRVRIRATMEKKKRATMFWLLIQSVTSWLPSIDSHSSGGSYPLWILVTAPSSVTFCLGMVQTLCC